jgi:hypothetical protein
VKKERAKVVRLQSACMVMYSVFDWPQTLECCSLIGHVGIVLGIFSRKSCYPTSAIGWYFSYLQAALCITNTVPKLQAVLLP